MIACVRAYNDFLADWLTVDSRRFVPLMALPFWDVDACIAEATRCRELGHKGMVFAGHPEHYGLPPLMDRHWDPLWAVAQDLGTPVNFHIGNSDDHDESQSFHVGEKPSLRNTKGSVKLFLANVRHIIEVICSGICHRFPNLNFVSVESGVGWVPFLVEAMDWQWKNFGAHADMPEMDLLASEYFKRQVYACFWFERASLRAAVDAVGPDNFLFETDFPHPSSMSPGPASIATHPRVYIKETLGDLDSATRRKLLHDNAARVYGID
jgi:predicted TIM-barrel fold metal-dependent hydrolase